MKTPHAPKQENHRPNGLSPRENQLFNEAIAQLGARGVILHASKPNT